MRNVECVLGDKKYYWIKITSFQSVRKVGKITFGEKSW